MVAEELDAAEIRGWAVGLSALHPTLPATGGSTLGQILAGLILPGWICLESGLLVRRGRGRTH